MILPTKHMRPDRALIAIGGDLLRHLREPTTVSGLWDAMRARRGDSDQPSPISYDWFVLALDLLFLLGAVEFDRGLLRKATP
jgi:hypothetical protein